MSFLSKKAKNKQTKGLQPFHFFTPANKNIVAISSLKIERGIASTSFRSLTEKNLSFIVTFFLSVAVMYLSNRSFNIPPGQPPGHLNFWKIFGKFPPHRAEKLFKCPPSRENYQITVLTFQKLLLCFWTWFIRQHIFIYYKDKSFLNTFKYGKQLVYTFGFQPIRHNMPSIFSFEFIKVWSLRRLRHDLSRNMTSRPAIKFPTPYEWWSNSLPPGQERVSNSRGMPGGECWSFDLTGT